MYIFLFLFFTDMIGFFPLLKLSISSPAYPLQKDVKMTLQTFNHQAEKRNQLHGHIGETRNNIATGCGNLQEHMYMMSAYTCMPFDYMTSKQ